MAAEDNPLLSALHLPAFSALDPEHIVPAIDARLAQANACIDALEAVERPSWENIAAPLEEAADALDRTWSPVRHLRAVADNPQWREAYNACLPKLSEHRTSLGQNEHLFRAYRTIRDLPSFDTLDQAQRKVINDALRDFKLSGVGLDEEGKLRFKALSAELSELTSRFSENVLDATQAWRKHVIAAEMLAGIPDNALGLAAENAAREGLDGWVLTLDFPIYSAVMSYAENRALREELYTAYGTRASDQGPDAGTWDNTETMIRILRLRHEMATLVGFESYAAYSLARKMASSPTEVIAFLETLSARSKPAARRELFELREYAADALGLATLEPWDVSFVSERLRQERYTLSQETLRPYFPISRVLDGLFEIVGRLFGIRVEEQSNADTWHPDVRFFEISTSSGEPLGQFYLDAYARAGKRGGAWMDECVVRRVTAQGIQLPVAYLCCNFSPPLHPRPSLLTHDEVCTLFHEFGHGLHHLLTQVDVAAVSGINGVPWDAVELPSQFLENWCWKPEGLSLISGHVDTGEVLPATLVERMLSARNFLAGMMMVRQLEFALFDFRIHAESDNPERPDINAVLEDVRRQVAVVIPPKWHRFAHAFTHIFSGGYAAGYYSYKWAEVLAADAFGRFEEEGLFDPRCGLAFRTAILERGGTEDALTLFREFRGRDPDVEALLRQCGMNAAQRTETPNAAPTD